MLKTIDKSILTTTSLVGITIVSGFILSNSFVSADDVVDDVAVTVPVSCTMSGSGMNSHTAEIANGTYQPNIGTTTMNVFCNDSAGFSIYAAGFSGNEIGGTNSNKLVGTSTSSNSTIDTGTATSAGNPDTSNWAMKLATDGTATYPITLTTGYNAFHAVPNEYTKVATREAGTDVGTGAEGATLTTTYAAYISKTQPADTYSGKVKYTLVHPSTAPAPIACNPNGTTIGTISCMQDISSTNKSSIIASMTEDQQYTLKDSRDGKTYYVARLKDGNIWMTQNLDLDIDSSKTYTPADTDIPSNWTPERSTYATGDTTWDWLKTAPESYNPGNLYWSGIPDDETPVSTGDAHYHVGNYYNWTAAVAMNDSSSYTTQYQDANQSICPAGWTLPKGGNNTSTGSFQYLVEQYGWDDSSYTIENPNIWNTPIKTSLSGNWYGSLSYVGYRGDFWSSVVEGSNYSYLLRAYYAGAVYPGYGDGRYYGISVRCAAR